MPRVSEQYKQDQRSEILDAARRCFVRNGFHRTSMQDVFGEAGKSAGAVYRYFPKKEDLIIGVATQNLDDLGVVLKGALERADDTTPLGEVLAELVTAALERHGDRQLATVALMVWSEALRDTTLAERLRAATLDMTSDLAGLIRERQHVQPWTGAPAEASAQVLLSILPGFLFTLAVLGPRKVGEFTDTVRTLWPT